MYKKKSLGQHFLSSPHYLRLIAEAAVVRAGEVVLEIGPGEGALTKALLARGARVIAIEKDRRLIPLLRSKFQDPNFKLIEGDALNVNPSGQRLVANGYTVVGNIPYYITGALFKKFLSAERQPERLVFLVQKEVAERIARSKKESILSLSVKAYGAPRYVATVPRGAFSPPPNVDSAILAVEDISRNNFKNKDHEERFFELVRAAFAHKRKLLASNLAPFLDKGAGSQVLKNFGISTGARAEDVPLKQWLELARFFCKKRGGGSQ